jgi:acetolactate synthase regulatory subunit
MANRTQEDFTQTLRDRFSTFVSRRENRPAALSEVIRFVRQRGLSVFAFGGTPRGVLHQGGFYRPRDLDLVFEDDHFEFFESAFDNFVQRRNSYGGLRLRIKDMAVDAWPLSATWAFRTGICTNPSFEKLPHTTFLNVDALVVELSPGKGKSRRIYEAGFFSAWKRKVLEINLRENPHPAVCVARTLSICRRFGFQMSHALATYLWEALTNLPMNDVVNSQVNHYGYIEFPADNLISIRQSLADYLSTSSLLPLALFHQMEFPFREESAANNAGGQLHANWHGPSLNALACDCVNVV